MIFSLFNKQIALIINILWVAVIFILCALPGDSIPDPGFEIPHFDKIVHFGMFFIQAFLLYLWAVNYTSLSARKVMLLIIMVACVYGALIEVMQDNYFGREGDPWDWLADVAGGIAGYAIAPLVRNYFTKA